MQYARADARLKMAFMQSKSKQTGKIPRQRAHGKLSKQARLEAKPFSLLDLPIEVRAIVLKELLYCSDPKGFESSSATGSEYGQFSGGREQWLEQFQTIPRLHPAILVTCKQMHQEGSPILFQNVIQCRIGGPPNRKGAVDGEPLPNIDVWLLGRGLPHDLRFVPPNVVKMMSSINIEIYLDYEQRNFELQGMMAYARRLALQLHDAGRWTNMRIELVHSVPPSRRVTRAFTTPDEVLYPFRWIRNRKQVTIVGVSEDFAKHLSTLMTSPGPCDDLDVMLQAQHDYLLSKIPHDDSVNLYGKHRFDRVFISRIWDAFDNELVQARNNDDVDAFYTARNKVMRLVAEYLMCSMSTVYEHDPPGRGRDYWLWMQDSAQLRHEGPWNPQEAEAGVAAREANG